MKNPDAEFLRLSRLAKQGDLEAIAKLEAFIERHRYRRSKEKHQEAKEKHALRKRKEWALRLRLEIRNLLDEDYELPYGNQYSVLYLDFWNETLCAKCANRIDVYDDRELPHAWFIHYEGPSEYCAICNIELPSEYGDPDEEDE